MAGDRRKGRKPHETASRAISAPAESLRPWLLAAVTALFVARPLFPSEGAPESGDGLPVVMLWIAVAVVWLLGAIGRNEFRLRFGATDAAVMLLVAWYAVSGILAAVSGSPRPAINALWEWTAVALELLLVRQLVASRREARAMAAVMLALALAEASYGHYQYFHEMPATAHKYHQDPDAALRDIGLWYPPGSPERHTFELRLGAREPIATFALTNSLAGFLVGWLTVAVGIAASAGLNRRGLRVLLTTAVAVVVMAACLVLTKSRSGYLAAVAALVPAWWVGSQRQPWSWKTAAVVVAMLAVIAALVWLGVRVGALDYEVLAEATKSLGYRFQYWQASLAMIADHPVFGCGPGQFQDIYTAYKLPASSEEIADPHNFLLEVWATAGTPAALALVAAIVLFSATLLRRAPRNPADAPGSPADRRHETSPAEEGGGLLPETAPADATPFILAGGAAGFPLSLPLGLMSSAPPGWIAFAMGLPLAVVFLTALWPWIHQGRLPPLLTGAAVLVLLLDLSAAGGIGFAGVAGSLWLLLALGLNLAEQRGPRRFHRSAAIAAVAMAMVVALACYLSAYGPVLASRTAIEAAHRQTHRAGELLHQAAAADPLAAEPQTQLAMRAFHEWQRSRTPRALLEFEQRLKTALRRDPHSNSAWANAGRLYSEAYAAAGQADLLEKAVEAYRRSTQCYPTNARYRADLALALLKAGDQTAFREQAEEALRLDNLTPHTDKKLAPAVADELRKRLSRNSMSEIRPLAPPAVNQRLSSHWYFRRRAGNGICCSNPYCLTETRI
ncbi:MAG: O-antigen ligase family protein [Pirellulales bacterium]|nr:O-antigen ligase family protein [Pirellulales bacterium]